MRLSGELKVHLGRLENNFSLLKKIAPKNEIIFMVKANAYGHGVLEVVKFSYDQLGLRTFGLASLGEAKMIRENLFALKANLLIFSDCQLKESFSKELYLNQNIIPVISNLTDLEFILQESDFKHVPLYLKFNTGMNRLGIETDELVNVIKMLKQNGRNSIEHLMTHFSSSYLPLKLGDRTHKQYDKFMDIQNELRTAGIAINQSSCANSGAIEQNFGLDCSHIRPGLMLYGAKSTLDSHWHGQCLSDLQAKVLKIIPVKKGVPIGYGAHICAENGFLVYMALGYGDGILTFYSGQKIFLYDKEAKIIGRVNMDITTIFFKDLPVEIKQGGPIYFWGEGASDITELASQLKTTPYQVFTAISSRVPRRYLK